MQPRFLSLTDKLILIFSGFHMTFGWLMFSFGMIFVWAFVMNSELVYLFESAQWTTTEGVVKTLEPTNASENKVPVYRFVYEYPVNGVMYQGEGFIRGRNLQPEQRIEVQHRPDTPNISRPATGRRALFPSFVAFVLIFPALGLGFILYAFRKNMKEMDLLVNGQFTRGKLVKKVATNVSINESVVYAYTFSFEVNGESYEAIGKTHQGRLLEDEFTERLVYAPQNPAYAAMYDTITNAPRLLDNGQFAPIPLSRAWVLAVPLLSVLVHGWVYVTFFA
ncbi:MAG: DUF3592 domain-containing protein [Bacteroidetes bacterium]|nr:MAG: DUF3592 domain-containing protein [Bacteroidota bacterium]